MEHAADLLSIPAPEAPSVATKRITAADIRQAMLKTWAPPEYAVLWEVRDATGFAGSRSADAVIMSLWPSRGLELHGVEIKVSRSDWRRESADPLKAETIASYCDRWFVHTPPRIVRDLSELPPAWGLREWDGERWVTRREAQITQAKPCSRPFLASLLRRADLQERSRIERFARDMLEADKKALDDRVAREVDRRTAQAKTLIEEVEKFEAASGLSLNRYYSGDDAQEIGRLVRLIVDTGVLKGYRSLGVLAAELSVTAERLRDALKESGFPFEEPQREKPKRP